MVTSPETLKPPAAEVAAAAHCDWRHGKTGTRQILDLPPPPNLLPQDVAESAV